MTHRCPDRAKIKGWAIVKPGEDPFRGQRYWWAIDVFATKREALRCKSPDEKIVRVEVRRG